MIFLCGPTSNNGLGANALWLQGVYSSYLFNNEGKYTLILNIYSIRIELI